MASCQCTSKPPHPVYRRRSQFEFTLRNVSLKNNPQYVAVSYCWGDDADEVCDVRVNGYDFQLRKHVSAMLGILHRYHKEPRVYVDTEATKVYSWLGEADPEIDCIFDVLTTFRHCKRKLELPAHLDAAEQLSCDRGLFRKIYSERTGSLPRRKPTDDPTLHEEFNWLRPFYLRPYWRRVWIVQELVLAEEVIVCCGDKYINFDDIYGLSLDWGSFEQGFDRVELDEAVVDKLIGVAKAKSSLNMVRVPTKFNINMRYPLNIFKRLLQRLFRGQVSKKRESNSSRWMTLQTIRGHRRRRQLFLRETEGEDTSPTIFDRGEEGRGRVIVTLSKRGDVGNFDEVLKVYAQHGCKCPKDKVYGFRELISAWKDNLVVDYEKSDLEVFLDAARLDLLNPQEHGGRHVAYWLWTTMGLGDREEFNSCLCEHSLEVQRGNESRL